MQSRRLIQVRLTEAKECRDSGGNRKQLKQEAVHSKTQVKDSAQLNMDATLLLFSLQEY